MRGEDVFLDGCVWLCFGCVLSVLCDTTLCCCCCCARAHHTADSSGRCVTCLFILDTPNCNVAQAGRDIVRLFDRAIIPLFDFCRYAMLCCAPPYPPLCCATLHYTILARPGRKASNLTTIHSPHRYLPSQDPPTQKQPTHSSTPSTRLSPSSQPQPHTPPPQSHNKPPTPSPPSEQDNPTPPESSSAPIPATDPDKRS